MFATNHRKTIGWGLLGSITALSLAPIEIKNGLHTTGSLHALGHTALFAVLAIAVIPAQANQARKIIGVLTFSAFGMALEAAQHFLYGNAFEWPDVLLDSCGLILGVSFREILRMLFAMKREQL